MAENKKGFILYADQKELFEQLPNDKAGELIKFIFAYVNDEEPITTDLLLNLAFTPIKQQFKRDLVKWESTREGRSKAGKASAEARKIKKEQQELTNSTNVKSVEQNSTNVNNDEQSSTNPTVNDNVNVNVNVKDKVIKETKEVIDFIYGLYPTKCLIKNSSTGKSESNKTKIATILKTMSKDKLSKTIEKYKKDCVTDKVYMKNFSTFLNNLPDYDSKEIDPNELDEEYIYYQWEKEPSIMARRVLKSEAEEMFKGQAMGGYKPKFIKNIKNKSKTWK